MRYIYDLGGKVVGAVDISENIIGKDIGTIMETEAKGISINDISRLSEVLEDTQPDIAVIKTLSFLNDI